ncbi:MAG TPA: hypothetical protein VMS12_03405 [Thermoanaerobaculia bacterium]|nr:hypothetical protein [Thermoanaerobaculia bacterium]
MGRFIGFFTTVCLLLSGITTSLDGSDRVFVPALADLVTGANQSRWQVEMRVFNSGTTAQEVRFVEYYPWIGGNCEGRDPVMLAPGEAAVIREFGCSPGSVSAAELQAGDNLNLEIVLTNTSGPQDPCCHTGFSTHIPVMRADKAYTTNHVLPNLPLPWKPGSNEFQPEHLIRHNMLIVNPNDSPTTVTYHLQNNGFSRDVDGKVQVPARSSVQVNDVFYPEPQQIGGPSTQLRPGYYTFLIASEHPVAVIDSQVNNVNNDATLYVAVPIAGAP